MPLPYRSKAAAATRTCASSNGTISISHAARNRQNRSTAAGPLRTRSTLAVSCALTADITQGSPLAMIAWNACLSGSSNKMAINAELSTAIIERSDHP
jgi:hypothetical protein